MKRITTTTLLIAGITLGAPAFLAAQGSTTTPPTSESSRDTSKSKDKMNKNKKSKDYSSSSSHKSMGAMASTSEFRRVSRDALENQTTAKDVIGQAVYSSDGEKLGDISDLTVSSDFQAARMAQTASRAERDYDSTSGSATAPGSLGSTSDRSTTAANTPSSSSRTRSSTSSSSSSSTSADSLGRAADDAWSSAKAMVGMDEPHAIISVGGVMGVGDNLVAVPVSALEFDSTEDRYTLSVTKSEFVAIAEQKPASDTDLDTDTRDN
ncbi:MAG: PRC-barrel domain-containing protein [Opitutaceae bacterium]